MHEIIIFSILLYYLSHLCFLLKENQKKSIDDFDDLWRPLTTFGAISTSIQFWPKRDISTSLVSSLRTLIVFGRYPGKESATLHRWDRHCSSAWWLIFERLQSYSCGFTFQNCKRTQDYFYSEGSDSFLGRVVHSCNVWYWSSQFAWSSSLSWSVCCTIERWMHRHSCWCRLLWRTWKSCFRRIAEALGKIHVSHQALWWKSPRHPLQLHESIYLWAIL